MKKVAILLADGFEEIEALTPMDVMKRAGVECELVSIDNNDYVRSTHGITVKTGKKIADGLEEYGMIICPGGMPGAKNLAENQDVINNIIEFNQAGKLIGAICAAPALVLSKAGVIDGRKATCYPGMEGYMSKANYVREKVVIDQNIITSQGPATALPFAYALLEKLGIDSTQIKEGMLYI